MVFSFLTNNNVWLQSRSTSLSLHMSMTALTNQLKNNEDMIKDSVSNNLSIVSLGLTVMYIANKIRAF